MKENKNLTLDNFKPENAKENWDESWRSLLETTAPKNYKLDDVIEAAEILAFRIAEERDHYAVIGFNDEYIPPYFHNMLHYLNGFYTGSIQEDR